MKRLIAAAIVFSAAAFGIAGPACAQDAAGDKVNQLIVYGDDPCPQSTENEITVCARKAEGERYRIPEPLRGSDSPENTAWTQRVESYEMVGKNGINSCSPVGAGGDTGCTQQLIKAAYADRKNGSDVKFGQMIAKERQERLSTIDADAAQQQADVEKAEKEYYEREAAERAAGSGDTNGQQAQDPANAAPPAQAPANPGK